MIGQKQAKEEDQALKATSTVKFASRGRGRNTGRGGLGRGRQQSRKESIECYHYRKLGHYRNECPNWEEKVNLAEFDEEGDVLLMAYTEKEDKSGEEVWFLATFKCPCLM